MRTLHRLPVRGALVVRAVLFAAGAVTTGKSDQQEGQRCERCGFGYALEASGEVVVFVLPAARAIGNNRFAVIFPFVSTIFSVTTRRAISVLRTGRGRGRR